MNANARALPRLNLCYLQKKAFQNHRKQITRIKSSLTDHQRSYNHHSKDRGSPKDNSYKIHSILQEGKNKNHKKSQHSLNPFQKRKNQQTEAENYRLYMAIKNCVPTISNKSIRQHYRRSQQESQRLLRFKTDPSSHHKVLKNKFSLQKITVQQKMKQSRVSSRLFKGSLPALDKSKVDSFNSPQKQPHRPFFKKNVKLSSRSPEQRQKRTQSLVYRNLNKLKHHFEDLSFKLLKEERLNGFRQKSQSANRMLKPQIHKWKTRCFTTQVEAYD